MKEQFKRKVLSNGITLLFEKRNLPVVSVAFAVKAGGFHESENEKGISHFIEHMLYKGTKNRTQRQIAEEIEKKGGELNGFTSEEMTAYYCKLPSEHIQTALDVLSDIVKNPLFKEKEINKERKIILEEIKMRKDNPKIYVLDEIQKYLYEKPFGMPLIGTEKIINSINKKQIIEKFNQLYKPNNMILCVVGNADYKKTIKFAEKIFKKEKGTISSQKAIPRNQIKIEKRKGIKQANFILAHHIPLAGDKKSYSARILNTLMGEGMSSRLFLQIREKRHLAYAVKSYSAINKDFAYNIIYIGTTKEKIEKVKKIILDEHKKVAEKLTKKELETTKGQIIGNYYLSMEDSHEQMVNLLSEEINGNAENFYKFEENIKKVTLEEIKSISEIKNYSSLALIPG